MAKRKFTKAWTIKEWLEILENKRNNKEGQK